MASATHKGLCAVTTGTLGLSDMHVALTLRHNFWRAHTYTPDEKMSTGTGSGKWCVLACS